MESEFYRSGELSGGEGQLETSVGEPGLKSHVCHATQGSSGCTAQWEACHPCSLRVPQNTEIDLGIEAFEVVMACGW